MEFNKPVSNPMMVGSIELLKAEDTPEHRQMFLEELQKAKFLAPVVIDPVPQPDEKGQVRIPRDASPVSHVIYRGRTEILHGFHRLDGIKKVEGRREPADVRYEF